MVFKLFWVSLGGAWGLQAELLCSTGPPFSPLCHRSGSGLIGVKSSAGDAT